jgi:hypothetical protein
LRRNLLFTIIAISIGASVGGTLLYSYLNRPPHSLEVDATRDTTDISGTLYRIRLTNTGTEQLTGIVAELGPEDVQTKDFLGPGQSYYFYPEPETPEAKIIVTTNEGIRVETDYRSPTKVLGLPGAGR